MLTLSIALVTIGYAKVVLPWRCLFLLHHLTSNHPFNVPVNLWRGKRWWKLEMYPSEAKVLTLDHQSLFTCFVKQACVKGDFDISLCWNMPDSLADLLGFCSINIRDDTGHTFLWESSASIRMFTVFFHNQADARMHGLEMIHVQIYIFMCVLGSISRAELRWATACCSAVTMPALVCIIYLPADWSRERHNHGNRSHAHSHSVWRNVGHVGVVVPGVDWISDFLRCVESDKLAPKRVRNEQLSKL